MGRRRNRLCASCTSRVLVTAADALEFLTGGLASKGYKLVSSVVVEAGSRATDFQLYAR